MFINITLSATVYTFSTLFSVFKCVTHSILESQKLEMIQEKLYFIVPFYFRLFSFYFVHSYFSILIFIPLFFSFKNSFSTRKKTVSHEINVLSLTKPQLGNRDYLKIVDKTFAVWIHENILTHNLMFALYLASRFFLTIGLSSENFVGWLNKDFLTNETGRFTYLARDFDSWSIWSWKSTTTSWCFLRSIWAVSSLSRWTSSRSFLNFNNSVSLFLLISN